MDNKERKTLTPEELTTPRAGSQAVPPETLIRQVQEFAEIHSARIFCGRTDLDAMNDDSHNHILFWYQPGYP